MRSLNQCLKQLDRLKAKREAISEQVHRMLQEAKDEVKRAEQEKLAALAHKKLEKKKVRWRKALELKERGCSQQEVAEYFDVTRQMAKIILGQAAERKAKGEL